MLKIVSSQLKLIPTATEAEIDGYVISAATAFRNEPFSLQILYRASEGVNTLPVSLQIDTKTVPAASWRVDYVPLTNAANDYHERGYVSDLAGIYPDLLQPRPLAPEIIYKGGENNQGGMHCEKGTGNLLNATGVQWQSVLLTLNPDSETVNAGTYTVQVKMVSLTTLAVLDEMTFLYTVLDADLPEHTAYYTNWFHVDCLCDMHRVTPYSEEFYEIFRSYMQCAVRGRQSAVLLPAFTPALDTPRNSARRNVQLVDITRDGNGWHFGFDRLARFIHEADSCGIRYFEHCHLFSQWGANHAPNIYDTDGRLLFGWQTDAAGTEYTAFLRDYLTAFMKFAADEKITERMVFHLSDEPVREQLENYRRAYLTVADLLRGCLTVDAMSDPSFWREGLVKAPVVFMSHVDEFDGCDSLWVYYTGGTYGRNCTNRLISNTAARTRVLGLQMYRYHAHGFLHWGYNYCYDRMSEGIFEPQSNPCAYKRLPGATYLAYPGRGCALPSLRETYMREAFDDQRALRLLETFIGYDAAIAFCENYVGTLDAAAIPEGNCLFTLRQAVNALIAEKLL